MLRVMPDYEQLSQAAALLIAERAAQAVRDRGRFLIALAGGSTPRRTYEMLAGLPRNRQPPWLRVLVYWGDERCVPPDDPRSNYRLAGEALLDRAPIPAENVHRIPGERGGDAAAVEYEQRLRSAADGPPLFDVVLLGLGDDGHTASLFPGSPALLENRRWVLPVRKAGDPFERVTLTLPALNSTRLALFIVSGAEKAAMLAAATAGAFTSSQLPARAIAPSGELLWLVDAAAAAKLNRPAP